MYNSSFNITGKLLNLSVLVALSILWLFCVLDNRYKRKYWASVNQEIKEKNNLELEEDQFLLTPEDKKFC